MANIELTKILVLGSLGFLVALTFTPLLTDFLYRNKLGKQIRNDGTTPLFSKMHASKAGTPTMGGLLIWVTVLVLAVLFWFIDRVLHISNLHILNFVSRRETLLPLGAFVGASVVGFVDDWLDVQKKGHNGKGFRFRFKVLLYLAVALIGAWWFYYKLAFTVVHVPFVGNFDLGIWFIPFFLLMVVGVSFSVNQTDGLDGLAGGTLMIAFLSYGLIAFMQGKFNLAALIGVLIGSLLAFLWFNVFPARFFMGDTGSMGMGVLLAIVAFLTNQVFLLFFFGFIFLIEAGSTFLQIFWKKVFGHKLFLSSPLHHHFEALGWPETKVTMRLWIIATMMCMFGLIVFFIS